MGRDKGSGKPSPPDVRAYNLSFETTKLAKHWDGVDLDLDWVIIEQSLAAPYCPNTILSQQVENKNVNPILSYSRSVWSTIHKACRMSHLNQS